MVWSLRLKQPLAVVAESAAAIAAATAAVALLDGVTSATSLGVVYVLAVMFIAIRRGELPALATAGVSVLVLNFLFIAPRHRLTIADNHNVVALGVLLVAGVVVARLATMARAQAEQAALRADQALAREREAKLLAEAASSLLASPTETAPVVGSRMEQALADAGARIQLCHAPSPRAGETALPLRMAGSTGWLYVDRNGPWTRQDADRVLRALSDLIGLAQERAHRPDRGGGRGHAPCRRRKDGGHGRDLTRPAHAADRDHHRRRRPAGPRALRGRQARAGFGRQHRE